jgi:hypothetical protein
MTIDDLKNELQMPVAHGGPSLLSMIGRGLELEQ